MKKLGYVCFFVLSLGMGLSMLSELNKKGYYIDHKHGMAFDGNGARLAAHIVIVSSVLGMIYAVLFKNRDSEPANSRQGAAQIIESFIKGTARQKDWERFLSEKSNDPLIDQVQAHCKKLPELYPPEEQGKYASAAGMRTLQRYAERLRTIDQDRHWLT